MGLFDKFKKEKPAVDWSQAHAAEPKLYSGPDGVPFGAIAMTEGTETILPTAPQQKYAVDGKPGGRLADGARKHHEGFHPGRLRVFFGAEKAGDVHPGRKGRQRFDPRPVPVPAGVHR